MNLKEAVEVNRRQYINSHGKDPKGSGMWMFKFISHSSMRNNSEEEKSFNGSFAAALSQAKKYASSRKFDEIIVMP